MTVYQVAGRISFGNVTGVQQFSMTRSRGIQPGTIQFAVPVVPQIPFGKSAPLYLSDGVRNMVFSDCLLQSVDGDYSNGQRYLVTLLDFRWKWAYGQISGLYNVVRGGMIVPATRKKPQDLAKLCLVAMGVTQYDLTQLPNDTYPEITWEMERPASALESLCSNLGCTICPQINGSVLIAKNAKGKKLPTIQGAELRESLKFGQVPDDIWVSAAPTVWEVSLDLANPYAIERTKGGAGSNPVESIVDYNKASYKPAGGWGNEDPKYFSNAGKRGATKKDRESASALAQESIWRMYGFKFPFKLPGLPFEITNINQLVFHDDLLAQTTVAYTSPSQGTVTELRRQKPFVYGQFFARKDTGKNNVETFSHGWIEFPRLIYPGGFSMDKERGIIIFSDAVYLYNERPEARAAYTEPNLFYRVAISVKDPATGEQFREVYKKPTGYRNSSLPLWVKRADLRREIDVNPENGKPYTDNGDNAETIQKELIKYAGYELEKLQTLNPMQGNYVGFIPIELDGCVEQVSYEISDSGETATTASYGYEFSLVLPSFEERRRIGMLNNLIKQQDQLANGKRDNAR